MFRVDHVNNKVGESAISLKAVFCSVTSIQFVKCLSTHIKGKILVFGKAFYLVYKPMSYLGEAVTVKGRLF